MLHKKNMKNKSIKVYTILLIILIMIILVPGCSWFTPFSHSNPIDPEYEGEPSSTPPSEGDPEIQIRQGSTIMESYGEPYDFGDVDYGSISSPVVFTIENIGGGIISVSELDGYVGIYCNILINGQESDMFGIPVDYNLTPEETVDFSVSIEPTRENQSFQGYIFITYNGFSSFVLTIVGNTSP